MIKRVLVTAGVTQTKRCRRYYNLRYRLHRVRDIGRPRFTDVCEAHDEYEENNNKETAGPRRAGVAPEIQPALHAPLPLSSLVAPLSAIV